MSGIGRIEEVPIREVWAHEAHDFTNWLATEGIEHLTDQLGLELADAATELPEGELFADIVATDSEGRTIVIENQLDRTDHSHLGQIISYMAIEGANAAIWISPHPRAEHVRGVEWLNEQTEADVWLVRVSAIRIGGSDPAPQFTVVAGPELSKQIKRVKEAGSADRARQEASQFWDTWLPIARERVRGVNLPTRGPSSVFFARKLVPGLAFSFQSWVTSTDAYAEIRIQDDDEDVSDAMYRVALEHREQIEAAFGGSLVWDPLEGARGAKIDTHRVDIGARSEPSEAGLIELADVSQRLIQAFKPLAEKIDEKGRAAVASNLPPESLAENP